MYSKENVFFYVGKPVIFKIVLSYSQCSCLNSIL